MNRMNLLWRLIRRDLHFSLRLTEGVVSLNLVRVVSSWLMEFKLDNGAPPFDQT